VLIALATGCQLQSLQAGLARCPATFSDSLHFEVKLRTQSDKLTH
jgi:hypothetical protein